MYNMRFNEDVYEYVAPVYRLNRFRVGQRVLYTGCTNYTYYEGGYKCSATREKATVISKSKHNIVIRLDNYRKPYRTDSCFPVLNGIEVIPPKQYAVITECDLACGDKHLEELMI